MSNKILNEIKYSNYNFFLEKLDKIFVSMDRMYDKIAGFYRFNCTGCVDNCCETLFYHHTLLEYLYLQKGFAMLPKDKKNSIQKKTLDILKNGQRAMCPVNINGLCSLYRYRPMICRLHGLPHMLNRPDGNVTKGPGCPLFTEEIKTDEGCRLDRTHFYMDMAVLEKELRKAAGFSHKIKITVAQMLS
ncbi:MAG TPA: hypothetical protein DD405_04800 [Desulfobacteraceae bacterium]|nr:hypothetical protein [Desulfobacteraceae bacterium]